jgi:hypothetical protein
MDAEIIGGPHQMTGGSKDAIVYRYRYVRDGMATDVYVELSGSLVASSQDILASPLNVIAATKGRTAVEDALSKGRSPTSISVTTNGIFETPTP